MFRLLVFLSIGRMLLGSRHRRRTLWRGLLAWGMLGFLANHHFDMENMEDEIREKAEDLYHDVKKARKAVRRTVKAARKDLKKAGKSDWEQRTAEYLHALENHKKGKKKHEERIAAIQAEIAALKAARKNRKQEKAETIHATPDEMQLNQEIVRDLERHTGTAAMMSNVPTLQFPEDDPKYHSARKYGYA